MWEPRRLTTLWALPLIIWNSVKSEQVLGNLSITILGSNVTSIQVKQKRTLSSLWLHKTHNFDSKPSFQDSSVAVRLKSNSRRFFSIRTNILVTPEKCFEIHHNIFISPLVHARIRTSHARPHHIIYGSWHASDTENSDRTLNTCSILETHSLAILASPYKVRVVILRNDIHETFLHDDSCNIYQKCIYKTVDCIVQNYNSISC
jgi:hypothetical protein